MSGASSAATHFLADHLDHRNWHVEPGQFRRAKIEATRAQVSQRRQSIRGAFDLTLAASLFRLRKDGGVPEKLKNHSR
jgi:hypothetical protein